VRLTAEELRGLLRMVDVTQPVELDCDGFLARVGGYLEQLGRDGTPPSGFEDVVQHLEACPECLEEFESLCRAWREEQA